ncbi:hypothetical protein RFX70_08470, partial [Acinetobacter baumannii]|nr:hypothetical protein [Acinetobacter baumannii]
MSANILSFTLYPSPQVIRPTGRTRRLSYNAEQQTSIACTKVSRKKQQKGSRLRCRAQKKPPEQVKPLLQAALRGV